MAEFCGLHGQEEGEGELHEQQDTGEHSKLMFGFFMRVKEQVTVWDSYFSFYFNCPSLVGN